MKGRPKCVNFSRFCKFKIKDLFLDSVHHNNYNNRLNYQYKIYCPEEGCFTKCVDSLF